MSAAVKNLGPIVLAVIVLAVVGWWIFWAYFDTYHLATVQEGVLYRDGVRSLHQFELAAHKTNVKTVVSLVDDREVAQPPFVEEMSYCQSNGIKVVRIPITLGGWPSGDQIRQFLSITVDPAAQPVLVHCAQGVRRTGMMVAAYQLSVLKFDKSRASDDMMTFGHSQRTIDDVQKFIDVYDPKAREMTAELPTSRE